MNLSKMLKTNAKRAMGGAWGRAAGILVIAALPGMLLNLLEYIVRQVGGVPEFVDYPGTPGFAFDDLTNLALPSTIITLAIAALSLLILLPLCQGIIRWYYRRTGGENDGVADIFYYFESARSYGKAFWLHVRIGLRIFFWGLLLLLPLAGGTALLWLAMNGLRGELPNVVWLVAGVLGVVWAILATVLGAIVSLRYLLAPYLIAQHPDWKIRRAIKQSARLMKGHKGSLLVFGLSFIGWWVLCLLILPVFFVVPYQSAAYALYARYLISTDADAADNATREFRPDTDHAVAQDENPDAPQPIIYPTVPLEEGTASEQTE